MHDYFVPLPAWQMSAWQQVTQQYHSHHLPHGLLAMGMAGIGKRQFVWHLVAWLLCQQKSSDGACGVCQHCHWLKTGVHPDVRFLPDDDNKHIKIDDIRALQDFFYNKSANVRVVVLDFADTMTIAAANALLKTLEEPSDGVYLILISDNPARLLPTIKSRVQSLPLGAIDYAHAYDYVKTSLGGADFDVDMLLKLADFAPMTAAALPNLAWYDKRTLWLKTYVALQTAKRSAVQASDYWQSVLSLDDFLTLSRVMLLELWRLSLGVPPLHTDIGSGKLLGGLALDTDKLAAMLVFLDDVALSLNQNVQEKYVYDTLMTQLAV